MKNTKGCAICCPFRRRLVQQVPCAPSAGCATIDNALSTCTNLWQGIISATKKAEWWQQLPAACARGQREVLLIGMYRRQYKGIDGGRGIRTAVGVGLPLPAERRPTCDPIVNTGFRCFSANAVYTRSRRLLTFLNSDQCELRNRNTRILTRTNLVRSLPAETRYQDHSKGFNTLPGIGSLPREDSKEYEKRNGYFIVHMVGRIMPGRAFLFGPRWDASPAPLLVVRGCGLIIITNTPVKAMLNHNLQAVLVLGLNGRPWFQAKTASLGRKSSPAKQLVPSSWSFQRATAGQESSLSDYHQDRLHPLPVRS